MSSLPSIFLSIAGWILILGCFAVFVFAPINLLVWVAWRLCTKRYPTVLVFIVLNILLIGATIFWDQYPTFPYRSLHKYGFNYEIEDAGERLEYPGKNVTLWIQTPKGKTNELFYSGEYLTVNFEDIDGDGIYEIIVHPKNDSYHSSIIKLTIADGKATGFQILQDRAPSGP